MGPLQAAYMQVHVLVPDARVELELGGRSLVGEEAHGGVGGGQSFRCACSLLPESKRLPQLLHLRGLPGVRLVLRAVAAFLSFVTALVAPMPPPPSRRSAAARLLSSSSASLFEFAMVVVVFAASSPVLSQSRPGKVLTVVTPIRSSLITAQKLFRHTPRRRQRQQIMAESAFLYFFFVVLGPVCASCAACGGSVRCFCSLWHFQHFQLA